MVSSSPLFIGGMKRALCLLFLLAAIASSAQQNADHKRSKRQTMPSIDITPEALARQLVIPYQTDSQKVNAIFRWITENISYNLRKARNRNYELSFDEPDDTSPVLKPLNQRVAENVLRRGMAVCDGYARLFKTLCDHAGIQSEIITGYARTGMGRNAAKFSSNHTWNAVFIDSNWHLLDVTWASGHITYRSEEFIRSYNNNYFLSAPARFFQDHYPEDIKWTLMENPPMLTEFNRAPFRYSGFIKSSITSYWPEKGIIYAAAGDSIRFEVESANLKKNLLVSDTPPVEPLFDEYEDPDAPPSGYKKLSYTYTVTNTSSEWLYVICDEKIILRYKLEIKEDQTARLSQN